jgi:hypothetical protein
MGKMTQRSLLPGILLLQYRCHGKNDTEIIITWYFVVLYLCHEENDRDHYYLVFCCYKIGIMGKNDTDIIITWYFAVLYLCHGKMS